MIIKFYTELKRRNVFKVGTAYLAASWLIIEVSGTLLETFGYDQSILRYIVIIIITGLIPSLVLSWIFEITPTGLQKESEIPREDSITAHTGNKLNFIIIGLLTLALAYFIYESRFTSEGNNSGKSSFNNTTSIAVLPFVNMSSDPEQEYFSDGISEEILNVLAKVPKLQVTSRSSAFAFKGKDINIAVVAKKLGVNNILEGSVRKAGNNIRITAQLITVGSDKHLWSETYDRKLTTDNIFKIQDEISSAIVAALKIKLGIDVAVVTRNNFDINLEAHNEYLKGRFYVEKRTKYDIDKALQHFNQSIEIEPTYAAAWVGKAWANLFLSESMFGDLPHWGALERARPAAVKALTLDPNLTEAHAIMGLLESINNEQNDAISFFNRAIELNPNYADTYNWLSQEIDDPEKIMALRKKAVQLNPLSLQINFNYAQTLISQHQLSMAEHVANEMKSINLNDYRVFIIFRNIRLLEEKWGEVAYYSEKIKKLNPKIMDDGASQAFINIGFIDLAQNSETDGEDNYYYELYRGRKELFINTVRENYPEPELDTDDIYLLQEASERAYAEYLDENYLEAIKYYLPTSKRVSFRLAYCYQQLGRYKEANKVINASKLMPINSINYNYIDEQSQFNAMLNRRNTVLNEESIKILGINYEILNILILEDKIEPAINLLIKAVGKGAILSYLLNIEPLYSKLRSHSLWQSIVESSDRTMREHQEIYLALITGN